MIQDELDLIERLVQKTKKFGICWACTKKVECWEKASEDEEEGFASECVDFDEEKFLDSYNILDYKL